MTLQMFVKNASWTKRVKYVLKCSGSGLDAFTDHQTSWIEVPQNKIELKSTNVRLFGTGYMAAAILDAILNNLTLGIIQILTLPYFHGLENKHMIRFFGSSVHKSRKRMTEQLLCLMRIVTNQAPSWANKDDIILVKSTSFSVQGLFVVSMFSGRKKYVWELLQVQLNLISVSYISVYQLSQPYIRRLSKCILWTAPAWSIGWPALLLALSAVV